MPPTTPRKRYTRVCSQPETLIFEHKIKLERLTVPALGSTFLRSLPNLVPRGEKSTLGPSSGLQNPVVHEVTWSPVLQLLFLTSPRRRTLSALPRSHGCPFPRSQELTAQQHDHGKNLMDGLGTADGKGEELVPARCLLEQEGCKQL